MTSALLAESPPDNWERWAFAAVGVTGAAAALIGLVFSANAVAAQVRDDVPIPWMAYAVPACIDLSITALLAYIVLLSRRGIRIWWLKPAAWAMTAASMMLNTAGQTTTKGIVIHAAGPALPVLFAHAAEGAATRWSEPTHRQRIRAVRWLLAPRSTAVMWRHMVLNDLTVTEALRAERRRQATATGAAPTRPRPTRATPGATTRGRRRAARLDDARRIDAGRGLAPEELMVAIRADPEGLTIAPARAEKYTADLRTAVLETMA